MYRPAGLFREDLMDLEAALETVNALPIEERITFVQRVLDGIASDPGRMYFPPAFEAELDRRIAEDDAHPERGIPWEEIDAAATARDAT